MLLLSVAAITLASPVHALTLVDQIRPPLEAGQFSVDMELADAGSTRFIIKRDLAHAPKAREVTTRMVRNAWLTVRGDGGLVGRIPVHPTTDDDGKLVYQFTLSDAYARKSEFTLGDSLQPQRLILDDVQWLGGVRPTVLKAPVPQRMRLVFVGAHLYSFRLLDFIDPSAAPQESAELGLGQPPALKIWRLDKDGNRTSRIK